MPREQRKRGKKHKGKNNVSGGTLEEYVEGDYVPLEPLATYNDQPEDNLNSDAQFGLLDPDVKAYFRTVNDQLKEWQDEGIEAEVDVDLDPNEQRRMFFTAALSEMRDKELQLSIDPECSVILERMLYSMDDFARRVFTDSLAGSWIPLMTNRFASHVCQTLLTLAIDTVNRETRGNVPSAPSDPEKGELLQMTQLVLDICEAIIPEISNLMQDQFASHVIRALLLLLCPSGVYTSVESHRSPSTRSKKSANWKAKQGEMKAIISDPSSSNPSDPAKLLRPKSFTDMAKRFLSHMYQNLGGNEVRALAVDKAASPLLQMFLELEAYLEETDKANSLMDNVLVGLVTDMRAGKEASSSAYVATLLTDSTSSHLVESLIALCLTTVFEQLWKLYFSPDIAKLTSHPVANFVVSRAILRLPALDVIDTHERLKNTWNKCLKLSRLGPLIAICNRAGQLGVLETELFKTVRDVFDLSDTTDLSLLVECVLRLKTRREYLEVLEQKARSEKETSKNESESYNHRVHRRDEANPLEPKIQGSLLLQAMLTFQEPHNEIVLDSLLAMEPPALLAFACHPTSSRVIDAIFESSTVNLRLQKKFVNAFIGQLHLLIDDRIGSRVADRLWIAADPYLKEKMARSLVPHEQFLAGSRYARFFTRHLNLPLLKRNPDQWKAIRAKDQQGKALSAANAIPVLASKLKQSEDSPEKRKERAKKRKDPEAEDEIDALFNKAKRHKSSKLDGRAETISKPAISGLDKSVLEAIKGAPHSDEKRTKPKKK